MKETFGATPYGGSLDDWPSFLVDAFLILREEELKVENFSRGTPPKPDHNPDKLSVRNR